MRNVSRWMLAGATCAVLIGAQLFAVDASANETAVEAGSEPSSPLTTEPTTRPDHRFERPGRPGLGQGNDGRGWGIREMRAARVARDRQGGFMQGRPPEGYWNEEPITDEDWTEIAEFLKKNCPVRLEMYDKLTSTVGKEHRWTLAVRRRLAIRYRDLQAIKERSLDMYEFAFNQIVLEDSILGTLREMHRANNDNDEAFQAKLREQVGGYVDNFLDEREARLKKLQEMVEKETKIIERDRASKGDLIEKQMDRFQREMAKMIEFSEDPAAFQRRNMPGR